jgi:sigma-B regulation protein RsbU (phosphoserine phosphatase)
LSRSVTRNIQKLVKASRQIASGDFKTRVRINSKDEMGELGRTFDRMVPELEERIQMKQALDVAMQVQQNLLPQKMPKFEGVDVAARSIYCDETGGDFYDFMDFCCRDPDTIGAVIGDVSGHGIPAALLMATARAFLRCRVTQPGDIAEVINDVNQLVAKDVSETAQFLTLFYMELNAREKKVEWIRAGHDPAFVYCPDKDSFEELRGKGLSLGVEDDIKYFHNTRSGLSNGQIIIAGTDGVWETQDSSGEMFGKNRLKDIIRRYAKTTSEDILDAILQELEAFRGDGKQEDDVTLVIMKIE